MYPLPKVLHIEPTTVCNAACPMCPRNNRGGSTYEGLPIRHIPMQDAYRVFTPGMLSGIDAAYFCGNYGEPTMHPNFNEFVRLLAAHVQHVGIDTNGGVHQAGWWHRLALALPKDHRVTFSIDGLEDTNQVYRRGVRFTRAFDNMVAFNRAGGNAEWSFLVFRHNEHQVDEAAALAKALHIPFVPKATGRFLDEHGVYSDRFTTSDGATLEVPLSPEYINQNMLELGGCSFTDYVDNTAITCKTAANRSVYIDTELLVFPCCWTGQYTGSVETGTALIKEFLGKYGKDSISLRHHTLQEIVGGSIFNAIMDGWTRTTAQGRVKACSLACGCIDRYSQQRKVGQ